MTIQEFIDKYKLSIESTKVTHNPNMNDQTWEANHYQITIFKNRFERNSKQFIMFYSMGLGIKGKPDLTSVLECLQVDISSCNETFDDWCSNLGYDTDSRKALDTYLTCQNIESRLRLFLGGESLTELRNIEF